MYRISRVLFFIILTLAIFSGCSNLKNGRYIRVTGQDNLNLISKEFGVPVDVIMKVNKGKKVDENDWFFIPLNWGLLGSGISGVGINVGKNYLWPVPATKVISSKFGKRWGKSHEGIDIPAPRGTHFLASESGKVIYSSRQLKSYGNMIILSHPGKVFTIYAHAKKLFVKKGESVERGQVIGQVGSTGRSTGPHLHFEFRVNDLPINPVGHFAKN